MVRELDIITIQTDCDQVFGEWAKNFGAVFNHLRSAQIVLDCSFNAAGIRFPGVFGWFLCYLNPFKDFVVSPIHIHCNEIARFVLTHGILVVVDFPILLHSIYHIHIVHIIYKVSLSIHITCLSKLLYPIEFMHVVIVRNLYHSSIVSSKWRKIEHWLSY